jgi:hypothetical protein
MSRTSVGPVERLEQRHLLSIAPVGGEVPVNAHTTSQQVSARVATAPDGSFVVAWSSLNQAGPTSAQDVYARRFTANGMPVGNEFRVNTHTTSDQSAPAIAMDDAGRFVVVWGSNGQDGAGGGIYAQRFDATAQPIGQEFRVNTYTGGDEFFPAVAMDPGGDFVVTWDTYNAALGDAYDVYAQRFDVQGQPRGSEFIVNADVVNQDYTSSVAMDDDGDFAVVWHADAQDGSGHGIYARRFDAAGQAQGGEFRVNTFTTGNQTFPAVAMEAGGSFVAVWQSDGQDGDSSAVVAQRFDAGGAPVGDEFIVNTYTTSFQAGASVATDGAGNFVVAWESFGPDQSLLGVRARAFRADGSPVGNEFGVNTHVVNDQAFANVSVNAKGDAVVVWQSRLQDGSENGVYAQRYRFDEVVPTVIASAFRFETAPHQVRFTFGEDVSASLSEADLTVIDLASGLPVATSLTNYDATTNTATFTIGQTLRDARFRATLAAAGITDPAGNALAADHAFDFFFLRGDANHDARVNLTDFNILAANFGQSSRDFTQGDFNYDTIVNLQDFNLLASRFGTVLTADAFVAAGTRFVPLRRTRTLLDTESDDLLA